MNFTGATFALATHVYTSVHKVSIWSSRSSQSSQNRSKRSGRSYGNTTETTETTRTIGTITIAWIASSSIRTIGAIVKICQRLYGNHSRMTRTIEAIQTYPKMHRLFQNSMLFLHWVTKNAFQSSATNTREWRRSSCTSVWYSKRQNFRINPYFIMVFENDSIIIIPLWIKIQ